MRLDKPFFFQTFERMTVSPVQTHASTAAYIPYNFVARHGRTAARKTDEEIVVALDFHHISLAAFTQYASSVFLFVRGCLNIVYVQKLEHNLIYRYSAVPHRGVNLLQGGKTISLADIVHGFRSQQPAKLYSVTLCFAFQHGFACFYIFVAQLALEKLSYFCFRTGGLDDFKPVSRRTF